MLVLCMHQHFVFLFWGDGKKERVILLQSEEDLVKNLEQKLAN